ncbi:MAG: aconitase X swivel domain-containing protein [Beijerinckiaceae bacterium]
MNVQAGNGARMMYPGTAEAPALVLDAPLSFWGGVDPFTGRIIAVRHPQHNQSVAGRMLVIAEPIGSSSSSAVLLELIRGGNAPAGILLGRPDAILIVGCLVAREMGWQAPPVLLDPGIVTAAIRSGERLTLDAAGWRRLA